MASGDIEGIAFRQSTHYRQGRGGLQPLWIVLHDAECSETATSAEALMAFGATTPYPWHYACDNNSTTQTVLEKDTAWHAGVVNAASFGIEIAGRASQDAAGWDDAFSHAAIYSQVVPLCRSLCARHGIPARAVDDECIVGGLATARRLAARHADNEEWAGLRTLCGGIITHAQVSRAFAVKGGHTDPGAAFPFAAVVAAVAAR